MKWLVVPLVLFILICGCSSEQPSVETETTIVTPTPVAVTATWIQTVGPTPTPTPTNNLDVCYFRNTSDYPNYCYDYFYWIRPTYVPPGSGYTARVWKNDGCINLNRTSGLCEGWGDNSFTVLFLHNLTIVRNMTSVNNTEMISAMVYYNKTYSLNTINDDLSFSSFVDKYWDGTYPGIKYDTSLFAPDPSVTIVPVDTFNPDAW